MLEVVQHDERPAAAQRGDQDFQRSAVGPLDQAEQDLAALRAFGPPLDGSFDAKPYLAYLRAKYGAGVAA